MRGRALPHQSSDHDAGRPHSEAPTVSSAVRQPRLRWLTPNAPTEVSPEDGARNRRLVARRLAGERSLAPKLQGSGVIVRTYATADGTVLGPEISTSDDLGELIWVDEANGRVAATTQPPARMIALDLAAGAEVAPPFESTTATSAGYNRGARSLRHERHPRDGIRRRPGSAPSSG